LRWSASSATATVTRPPPDAAPSSAVSARRASPPAVRAMNRSASSSASTLPASPCGAASARRRSSRSSSSSSGRSVTTRVRLSSAELTSKLGFSVVAPSRVSVPRSTCGSSASCCALLKRWISSRKRTVRWPWRRARSSAWATASRMSFTPADTADIWTKAAFVAPASSRARVVFPVPGGPQRMSEGRAPPSTARRSRRPGPVRCSWPTSSSREAGRIRSASGPRADVSRSLAWANRSMVGLLVVRACAQGEDGCRRGEAGKRGGGGPRP